MAIKNTGQKLRMKMSDTAMKAVENASSFHCTRRACTKVMR